MKHHLILLTILAFATGALAAKPQAPASVARLLAMLDQPPSRAQCIEFNTDDYALHQASYLPYPKLLTLYLRSATVCPDYFQGSTALDAHAREVFGTIRADSFTSLLFANIEERYVSYLQQRNLLQTYLLSPQGDVDRQSNNLSVTHVAEWVKITNHSADSLPSTLSNCSTGSSGKRLLRREKGNDSRQWQRQRQRKRLASRRSWKPRRKKGQRHTKKDSPTSPRQRQSTNVSSESL